MLADAAAERLRPIADPDDTGSLAGDLSAFVMQYAEEMGSPVGRALLRDVLAETDSDVAAARCCAYTTHHLQTLNNRALKRGEAGFSVDEAIDILIAPICYRILFANGETSPDYVNGLLARFARLNEGIEVEEANGACVEWSGLSALRMRRAAKIVEGAKGKRLQYRRPNEARSSNRRKWPL